MDGERKYGIYTMEYYYLVKITLFMGKWMEVKIILLSEINQTEEEKYSCSLSHVESRP
jgi:hypothetical protein